MAHASTLILFVRDLIHETKNTSGTGSTLSIVFARATSRLARINPSLASEARKVLDINKQERHIRGGLATKEKYLHEHNLHTSKNI